MDIARRIKNTRSDQTSWKKNVTNHTKKFLNHDAEDETHFKKQLEKFQKNVKEFEGQKRKHAQDKLAHKKTVTQFTIDKMAAQNSLKKSQVIYKDLARKVASQKTEKLEHDDKMQREKNQLALEKNEYTKSFSRLLDKIHSHQEKTAQHNNTVASHKNRVKRHDAYIKKQNFTLSLEKEKHKNLSKKMKAHETELEKFVKQKVMHQKNVSNHRNKMEIEVRNIKAQQKELNSLSINSSKKLEKKETIAKNKKENLQKKHHILKQEDAIQQQMKNELKEKIEKHKFDVTHHKKIVIQHNQKVENDLSMIVEKIKVLQEKRDVIDNDVINFNDQKLSLVTNYETLTAKYWKKSHKLNEKISAHDKAVKLYEQKNENLKAKRKIHDEEAKKLKKKISKYNKENEQLQKDKTKIQKLSDESSSERMQIQKYQANLEVSWTNHAADVIKHNKKAQKLQEDEAACIRKIEAFQIHVEELDEKKMKHAQEIRAHEQNVKQFTIDEMTMAHKLKNTHERIDDLAQKTVAQRTGKLAHDERMKRELEQLAHKKTEYNENIQEIFDKLDLHKDLMNDYETKVALHKMDEDHLKKNVAAHEEKVVLHEKKVALHKKNKKKYDTKMEVQKLELAQKNEDISQKMKSYEINSENHLKNTVIHEENVVNHGYKIEMELKDIKKQKDKLKSLSSDLSNQFEEHQTVVENERENLQKKHLILAQEIAKHKNDVIDFDYQKLSLIIDYETRAKECKRKSLHLDEKTRAHDEAVKGHTKKHKDFETRKKIHCNTVKELNKKVNNFNRQNEDLQKDMEILAKEKAKIESKRKLITRLEESQKQKKKKVKNKAKFTPF